MCELVWGELGTLVKKFGENTPFIYFFETNRKVRGNSYFKVPPGPRKFRGLSPGVYILRPRPIGLRPAAGTLVWTGYPCAKRATRVWPAGSPEPVSDLKGPL
jgi:hypothetical protein